MEDRLHDAIRQQGELQRGGLEIEQTERVAGCDAEQLPLLEAAQFGQRTRPVGGGCAGGQSVLVKLLTAFDLSQAIVLRQPGEIAGILQQDLRQVGTADEQPDQDFDGSGMLGQVASVTSGPSPDRRY